MSQIHTESQYRLLDTAPNAMLIAGMDGRIVYVNPRAGSMFGYLIEELCGKSLQCLLPARYRDEYLVHLRQHMAGGTGLKLFAQCKNGSEIAVEIDLSPLPAPDDSLTMAAIRSIDHQPDINQQPSASSASLAQILDSVNDVVWSVSPSGDHVLFVNAAWERVFGHSHIEAQNNPGLWQRSIHPEDHALTQAGLETLLKAGQLDMEYRIVRPDGTIRWISDHATLVRDAQGVPARIDGIGRDVTRQKLAEQQQQALLQELKAVNDELQSFAYVVSHDLKAPLRAIGALAEWIASDYAQQFDEEGREHLRLLVGRARRMNALIDGILQYSRVGRLQEDQTAVSLGVLLEEAIDSLGVPANVTIGVDDPMPTLRVERTRIYQVFQNLLSNAIKHGDKPQIVVHVGCTSEKQYWIFRVSDNGPGIEQRHFERIFQLFQTLVPRDRMESTGVGLALVKKIIEIHGGSVWLESVPGEGSTFFFSLPKGGK